MSIKSIFIIIITVLVTVVLMKNQDEVTFWIFGDTRISKLVILMVMFGLGFIVGALAFKRKKKKVELEYEDEPENENSSNLSDEDREYIR